MDIWGSNLSYQNMQLRNAVAVQSGECKESDSAFMPDNEKLVDK